MNSIGRYVLIGLLICSIVFNLTSLFRNSKLESENLSLKAQKNNVEKKIQTEASIIARQVDKFGSEHVTISATENVYPASTLRQPAVSTGLLDTVAMALKIKTKQVEELTRINSTLNVKNARAYYSIDSLKRRTIQYRDKYVSIAYTPDTTDTIAGTFDFKYAADIKIAQYYKRNWFLGAKKSYIDVWSQDNRVTINGVDRFQVEQKDPAFGLRIQASSTFHPKNGIYGFGGGARIDLGRFSVNPNYIYYPNSGTWAPNLQVNYDLIRF